MGYLIFQILFFLLIAALLGFGIGWLWRGAQFKSELKDLDVRWRAKLADAENERDRFASELMQAKEARVKSEVSAAEARQMADAQEESLQQLRRDHETKLGLLSQAEERVGGLEASLSSRETELAAAKEDLERPGGGSDDSNRLNRELAAAEQHRIQLEGDLREAREANGACKTRVASLEAEIASLKTAGYASSATAGETDGDGGALGFMGSGTSSEVETTGATDAGGSSGGAVGFMGSMDAKTASNDAKASADNDDDEGVRPVALSTPESGSADDLKKISGVGPKLEKTLNDLGIFHFAQIAAFSRDNVAWVDRHLRFKGRIERENWIEQAKVLAAGGETEFSRRS